MSIDYSRNYVKQALAAERLEPPDKTQANGTYEALMGLFMAHSVGGIDGVMTAWETLKMLRPDLADFDRSGKLIHADKLKDLPQPSFLMGDYPIYHNALNVLVGKSGGGKSFVSVDMAGRIAAESTVVYIAGEGVHGYSARWESWKSFHQCHKAELYFWTEALQIMQEREIWAFFSELEDKGKKPSLVIIDTLARSAVGVDENSAQSMGQFIAAVDNIRSKLDCAALVVHHTGKNGDIRGSNSLYGAADAVLALSRYEGLIRLSNKQEYGGKNKYNEEAFDQYYKITKHSANGFDGAVIVPAEKLEDFVSTMPANRRSILEALAEAPNGLTGNAIMEATGFKKSTTYNLLKDLEASYEYVESGNGLYSITENGKEALAMDGFGKGDE